VIKRRPHRGDPAKIYPSAIVHPGARIGTDVVIGAFTFVADGAVIGAGTRIQGHTSVFTGVVLGDDVFVGPGATFTNVRHPRAAFPRAPHYALTHVSDGATLGAGSILVAPVHLGANAFVAAGAVVTKDVAPHALVAGNPARVLGWACTCGETLARGARRPKRAQCTHCTREFEPDPRSPGLREKPSSKDNAPQGARSPRRSRDA
jgi:UDP-2-acetamido-3-amino-2,3-dideoxy-glucuronate N-acetyltransferase